MSIYSAHLGQKINQFIKYASKLVIFQSEEKSCNLGSRNVFFYSACGVG